MIYDFTHNAKLLMETRFEKKKGDTTSFLISVIHEHLCDKKLAFY